jgi:hypothetical protein
LGQWKGSEGVAQLGKRLVKGNWWPFHVPKDWGNWAVKGRFRLPTKNLDTHELQPAKTTRCFCGKHLKRSFS